MHKTRDYRGVNVKASFSKCTDISVDLLCHGKVCFSNCKSRLLVQLLPADCGARSFSINHPRLLKYCTITNLFSKNADKRVHFANISFVVAYAISIGISNYLSEIGTEMELLIHFHRSLHTICMLFSRSGINLVAMCVLHSTDNVNLLACILIFYFLLFRFVFYARYDIAHIRYTRLITANGLLKTTSKTDAN